MSEDDFELDSDEDREEKRRELLATIASYCIQRNFKFDCISPKKWITLTFESRNEKQDKGIDIFIDVRETDDLYFVVPAAYDILIDEEIPAVIKAVNINNNYVNPARCSYSEKSKKVIVDYTFPIIDGRITLEQFTRILMFVLESAEALRDNISKVQKKLEIDEVNGEPKIPDDMKIAREQSETKKYTKSINENIEEKKEDRHDVNILEDIKKKSSENLTRAESQDSSQNSYDATAMQKSEHIKEDDIIEDDDESEEDSILDNLANLFDQVKSSFENLRKLEEESQDEEETEEEEVQDDEDKEDF